MSTFLSPKDTFSRLKTSAPLIFSSDVAPGIALCMAVTLGAWCLQIAEAHLFGRAWLESLVLAILLGTAIRSLWTPGERWLSGIAFSAKTLLEVAVMLLGASFSATALKAAGIGLLLGIVAIVIIAIGVSYGIGRALKLNWRMALLVACGNSICGNSAIAAVAPVIGANRDDVAASIAFTAVLGVLVVLGLPLLSYALHLNPVQYGALAGLTVYAVPQVLAATVPVSALSAHIGTLVKLVRVLMLGPVMLLLSIVTRERQSSNGSTACTNLAAAKPSRIASKKLVPWFIIGFLVLGAARSAGLVPAVLLAPANQIGSLFTIVSMAALGLGVDIRTVAKAGPRVTAAVVLSIVALAAMSLLLIVGLLHLS
ncbi:putative sulfate exporter family transporter [Trinickia violacea]|uniref:Putative sulfate exporter family transporter n=1 Tax=Trinickia violacea TaxID=2571746 RepID=A0A4P8IZ74_9BURK|nr:putative sulfate exporter family transporter [Trinickia violacea]QCP52883.1 putative sulfate exporter family transporter [Trinickia violacea]